MHIYTNIYIHIQNTHISTFAYVHIHTYMPKSVWVYMVSQEYLTHFFNVPK